MSVYRPDLYNPDNIIILENKRPYLNIYRPGGADPTLRTICNVRKSYR